MANLDEMIAREKVADNLPTARPSGTFGNLRRSAARFAPVRVTDRPILITTVRKAMTHAVRSLFVHILGLERLHRPFIGARLTEEQFASLRQEGKQIFVGHVERTMDIEQTFKDAIIILVIRDPLTCVPSRVRRLFNPERPDALSQAVQSLGSVETAYHYAIFGGSYKGASMKSLADDYRNIAAAWLHRADLVLRYEELRSERAQASVLSGLRHLFGGELPPDIELRITAGLDPSVSASFDPTGKRFDPQLPLEDMINVAIPGMRKLLGYSAD